MLSRKLILLKTTILVVSSRQLLVQSKYSCLKYRGLDGFARYSRKVNCRKEATTKKLSQRILSQRIQSQEY